MPADLQLLVRSEEIYRQVEQLFVGEHQHDRTGSSITTDTQVSARLIREATGELEQVPGFGGNTVSLQVFLDDDYASLIPYQKQGLKTVWLNQEGQIAPDGMPVHDDDITELQDLVMLQKRLAMRPSLQQCLAWWDAWHLPENVRAHCVTVAWAAYALGVLLRQQGMPVDPILAHRGGLVHDLDKIRTLHLKGAHGVLGAEFLAGQGYPLLTKIVREHIMHTILKADAADRRWENKLVYFCDKCVEGDQIVTFDQRLEKLRRRYPQYQESMRLAEDPIWALSDQICSLLGMASHDAMIAMLKHLRTQTSD